MRRRENKDEGEETKAKERKQRRRRGNKGEGKETKVKEKK